MENEGRTQNILKRIR